MLRINVPEGAYQNIYGFGVDYKYPQVLLQRALRFMGGISPVMVATLALAEVENLPTVDAPYKQIITAVSINGIILVNDALRTLATEVEPLEYLRKIGDGNTAAGFRRLGWREAASMLPPLAAATAYGVTLYNVCGDAMNSGDINTIILCATIQGALMNALIVSPPSWLLYGMTSKLIECCAPLPIKAVQEYPETNLAQNILNASIRLTDSMIQSEFIRAMMLTFSPPLMHLSCAPLLPIVWDQFVLAPLKYLAWQPLPIKNLQSNERTADVAALYEEENLLNNPIFDRHARTRARAKMVAFYTASATISLGICAGIHYLFIDQLMEERDPETMPEWKRASYEAGLLTASYLINKTIQGIPSAISSVRNWYRGLSFFAEEPEHTDESEEFIVPVPVRPATPEI